MLGFPPRQLQYYSHHICFNAVKHLCFYYLKNVAEEEPDIEVESLLSLFAKKWGGHLLALSWAATLTGYTHHFIP